MRLLFYFIMVILLLGCGNKQTVVNFHVKPFYKGKVYVEKISYSDEPIKTVDSAYLDLETDKLVFKIAEQEQGIFQIRIKGHPQRIYFINDNSQIEIYAITPDASIYSFKNSLVNASLKNFQDEQSVLKQKLIDKTREGQSWEAMSFKEEPSRNKQHIDSLQALIKKRNIDFIDTTRSPGAYLFVYNQIDFGKDLPLLKNKVVKAAKRFPRHKGIEILTNEVLKYIKILEEEYIVGDYIPDLTLPDQNGIPVSINAEKGKFLLIDFWSTWCPQCLNETIKKEVSKKYGSDNFKMINIAIDAEKERWQQIVHQKQLPGVQLIDDKMWKGKTVEVFKIDSIPHNFLVSPEGKILAKAIKPDSLLTTLSKFIN